MIGAKTITSLLLLVIMTAVVWSQGYLNIAYLARLDPWVAALLGVFASLTGTMVVRVWRLDERSLTSFRYTSQDSHFDAGITLIDHLPGKIKVGESTEEPPRDLPPVVQRVIYVILFLWVGIFTFNNRTFALLKQTPERIRVDSTRYCDDPGKEQQPEDPKNQGCELVMRAYHLGYAEDLGPCEKKDPEKKEQPCTLRQRDEPYIHYAWRLLVDQASPVMDVLSLAGFREFKEDFQTKLDHLDMLYDAQSRAITNMPRASHHLFTNLPHPRPGRWGGIQDLLEPGHFVAQTSLHRERIAMASGDAPINELLEHVFNQLLFDPGYKPIVGVCGEYAIHWDAPPDACRRLAKDPQAFLAEANALEPVLQVLKRYEHDLTLGKLRKTETDGVGSIPNPDQVAPPDQAGGSEPSRAQGRVVSFQCFMEDAGKKGKLREYSFKLDGHRFRAAEIRFASTQAGHRRPAELAHSLATLLAPGFHYGRLMSRASITQRDAEVPIDELFAEHDFRLAKLEYLRDTDLFLEDKGIAKRADLYEVYPYHLHLKNFVEVFRRQYKLQRGRL